LLFISLLSKNENQKLLPFDFHYKKSIFSKHTACIFLIWKIYFYIFLCIYEKFANFENRKEITEKSIIFFDFRKITNSDPQIEGLCVNFPQISVFRGHFLQNQGPNFVILTKKLPSRGRKMRANNLRIFTKNGGERTEKILKKIAEI